MAAMLTCHVTLQGVFGAQDALTHRAGEAVCCVQPQVVLQVAQLCVHLTTHTALVRFLSCVEPHVSHQRTRRVVRLAAEVTDVPGEQHKHTILNTQNGQVNERN